MPITISCTLLVGGALQNLVQNGERGFAAFQREALLAHEAGVQEMFELFAVDQAAQHAQAGLAIERPVVGLRLHALLQPALLLRHLNVHVLAADLAAVGLAQRFQNFAQRGHRLSARLRRSLRPGCR